LSDPLALDLIGLIGADADIVRALEAVAALGLPDCWITAGMIRNRVYDRAHGYAAPTPLNDVDVIYFDPDRCDESIEKRLEAALRDRSPDLPWSVKNQARMAARNGDLPYRSSSHALEHWCETPTAVGARLQDDRRIEVIAPLGLVDLFDLVVRPTPHAGRTPAKLAAYRARMAAKNWPARWPRLQVLDLEGSRSLEDSRPMSA
jgi:hypothetical protein